jgi:hypothetical protein
MKEKPPIQTYPFEWEQLIQKNTEYYLKIFRAYEENGTKEPWNWASAIFGVYWFAYRKMFREAKFFFAVVLTITVLQLAIIANAKFVPISVVLDVGLFLYFGFAGNHLYYLHVNRTLGQIHDWEERDNYLIDWYTKAGGTSILSVLGFYLAMAAITVIMLLVVFAVLF